MPKFQSIPATPQFFDLAGAYNEYPDLSESINKYKQAGGLIKKLTGLFGRKWKIYWMCVLIKFSVYIIQIFIFLNKHY